MTCIDCGKRSPPGRQWIVWCAGRHSCWSKVARRLASNLEVLK